MSARRSITAVFIPTALAAAVAGLLLGPAPALAGKFKLSSSFGGVGTGSGQFETPRGVAVEASTPGDVFVVDSENKRVEKFNPDGTKVESIITGVETPDKFAEEPIGAAVDSSGDVYVAVEDEGARRGFVDKFKPKGTSGNEPNEYEYECQLTGPGGGCLKDPETEGGGSSEPFLDAARVATDSAGNLYVGEEGSGKIYEFGPGGADVATLEAASLSSVFSVAVDASGSNVYATSFEGDLVKLEVNTSTHTVTKETVLDSTNEPRVVTVDASGNAYVVDAKGGSHVAEYDASGTPGREFGAGEMGRSSGIAYSPFNEEIYVSDLESNDVHIFAEAAAPPEAVTEPASAIAATSARLNGTINPNGVETESWFEYGACTTPSACATSLFGSQATAWLLESEPPSSSDGSGSVPVDVTARLAPLEPNATYHYELKGRSTIPEEGAGKEQEFTTLAALPTVNDQPPAALSITPTSALLSGTVNPMHSETTYYFEFVDQAGFDPEATDPYSAGARTAKASAGEGFGDQTVAQQLTSLLAGTTYHYRLVATNQAGTVTGPDHTFTTSPGTPPLVTTGPASGVTQTTATISGTVDPQGIQTSYEFELGSDTSYGTQMFAEVGAGSEAVPIALALQDLAPGTTYHYRMVATNADGTAYGADQTFTTPTISSPIVLPLTAPLIATTAIALPTEIGTTTTTATKTLTRVQKLAAALKACRMKVKGKRAACEKRARKKYAPTKAKKTKKQ
jgi:hypothetical protein